VSKAVAPTPFYIALCVGGPPTTNRLGAPVKGARTSPTAFAPLGLGEIETNINSSACQKGTRSVAERRICRETSNARRARSRVFGCVAPARSKQSPGRSRRSRQAGRQAGSSLCFPVGKHRELGSRQESDEPAASGGRYSSIHLERRRRHSPESLTTSREAFLASCSSVDHSLPTTMHCRELPTLLPRT
jgi:hypothetical protein